MLGEDVRKLETDSVYQRLHPILMEAGQVALEHFRGVRAVTKSDGSQVTTADQAIEALLVDALGKAFPGDGVISEEGARVESDGACWFVDPIDGTSSYVEGLAHWGPTVCRVKDGVVESGALWLPRLNEFWYARRGCGAWRNAERVLSSDSGKPGRHHSMFIPSRAHRMTPIPWPGKVRSLGSSAAHLCLVAVGAAQAAIIPTWHLWDVGAGALMIEESGRSVCDAYGAPVNVASCQPGLPLVAGASSAVEHLVGSDWIRQALG